MEKTKGTVWTESCPSCGEVHTYKRPVISVGWYNELKEKIGTEALTKALCLVLDDYLEVLGENMVQAIQNELNTQASTIETVLPDLVQRLKDELRLEKSVDKRRSS